MSGLSRRSALAAALGATAAAAAAQNAPREFRLGHLALTPESERATREFTLPELATFGFAEGRNLAFEPRVGTVEALPVMAREILATNPQAVISIGAAAIRIMREASASVPIVMFGDDPVGQGFAQSFARPGGNITGIATMVAELNGKRLELLLEAMPGVRRVGALLNPTSPVRGESERALRAVAESARIELNVELATSHADYAPAFAAIRAARVQGLLVGSDPVLFGDTKTLVAMSRAFDVPLVCEWAESARDGCVIGYGPNRADLRRRLARYVALIFRGVPPSELPIERPTRFELAVNLVAARAFGVGVPPAILVRADEVIE